MPSLSPLSSLDLTYKFNTERQSNRPIATTVRVARLGVPWYNEDIHKAKRLRRKAERTWRSLLGYGTKNVERLAR